MKSNAGFIGFDGTENKRTLLALDQVKKAANIGGDYNLLLRMPHGRAQTIIDKYYRMCEPYAVTLFADGDNKAKWEGKGYKISGGSREFYDNSGFIMIGAPGDQELPYLKDALKYGCFVSLMGGADRPELLKGLEASKEVEITDALRDDFKREFFFGLENYDMFQKAQPELVQCTSCNTTGLSRMSLAARPLGLEAVFGNIDRRHGDPHTVVKASPSAIQFGKKAGHQGADAGTVFEDVRYSVRANKVPTTVPHTNFLSLAFKGDVTKEDFVKSLANTREVVVMPYDDEGKKHDWTSEILEAYQSGIERPISPEIFELIVSDAAIPFKLGDYTILQTVGMVEQMSIAVPNHVESYLLDLGYPSEQVHELVDGALKIPHGIWPNKLSY